MPPPPEPTPPAVHPGRPSQPNPSQPNPSQPSPSQPSPSQPSPRTLSVTDVVSLGPAALVTVVATCSLALAHAHHHTLAGVIVATVVVTGLGVGAAWRFGGPVRITADRRGLVALGLCGVVAALMFLPGFSYGVTDRDPGGYVAHGLEIAHHGSYSFTDPVLARRLPEQEASPGAVFPGVWIRNQLTGQIVPQFYHLWPALIATAFDVGGLGGVTALTPLVGILGVLVLVGLIRRLTGSATAAGLAGVLMATNMLQVWQSKTPSTEVFAETVFLAMLACLVLAVQERWHPAAFFAGLLVDVAFLNRADAWLLLMLVLGGLAVLWVLRLFDGRALAFLLGLVALLPYALWQAYYAARDYTALNSVPSLKKTAELSLVLAVAALAGRRLFRPVVGWLGVRLAQRRPQLVVGVAFCTFMFGLLTLGFERPRLFGADHFHVTATQVARSYDEAIMARLAWFVTLPGFALAGLGIAVVALRRWSGAAWLAILPGLVLFPVFAYHARISPRLMFWARRYVSYSLPLLLLLMGLALGFALVWQWKGRHLLRVPAVLAAALITGLFLAESLPLRHHDEWHGSFAITHQVADLAGGQRGIYLWQSPPYCCDAATSLFATPVWLEWGQLSVPLPDDATAQADAVRTYRKVFPQRPVFVVWEGTARPPALSAVSLTMLHHFVGTMPFWQESDTERPHRERIPPIPYDFVVYRVG